MGSAAARVAVEGADVGQTAEPVPDDYSQQWNAAQWCFSCSQKGVYVSYRKMSSVYSLNI